jgi:hypothetical protein
VLILKRAAAIVFLAAAIPYALAPVYRFPSPRTFTGPEMWNPYAHLGGTWQRANLHAHGHAWSGLTNGTHTDDEVVAAYRQRGYSVAGVSDYQWIAARHGVPTLPLYEHGYNISKEHQLAIGAKRVEWIDFPFWTWLNQKQYIINRVASTSALVAINHPGTAYSEADLRRLTGYHLMEVINGPFEFEELWDAALSSGHPIWALANDDIHDLSIVRRLAIAWNMIDAPSAQEPDIIAALREGRSYAISLVGKTADAALAAVRVHDSALTVSSTGVPATYVFIGQDGAVLQTSDQVMQATYPIKPDDTYIRTVIRTPNMVMYLNPVLRCDGASLPAPVAVVNEPLTWASHVFVVLLCLTVPPLLWRRRRTLPVLAVLVIAELGAPAAARAQAPAQTEQKTEYETNLSLQMLRDLPASNNLFSLLETVDANVITDRFYGGGLNTGRTGRVGAFLSSWTQTQYRVNDVNITAPDGSGSPFLFPTLPLFERVTVSTGFMPPGLGAPGLGVSLEPMQPSATWTRVVDASFAGSGLVAGPSSGAPAPPIHTLSDWRHVGFLGSGPIVPGRLGLVTAIEWTDASQIERAGATQASGRTASVFANVVFAINRRDEIHTVGWFQRTQAPFVPALSTTSATPSTATDEQTFTHLQSTWQRVEQGLLFRLFGAYSQRTSTRNTSLLPGTPLVIERLTDGPAPLLAASGDRSDSRWSAGLRAAPAQPPPGGVTHALQFGADIAGGASRVAPFAGTIGELVDGARARMWTFASPGVDAQRHETTFSAYLSDHIQMGARVVAEAGVSYDGVRGSADNAAQGVSWNTLLGNASFWWAATKSSKTWIFAGYRRAADSLPLDMLAYGDPAAPAGTVSAWTSQGIGPVVARVGPGTGGDPAFSAIDASLSRPTTDEFTVGVETRPMPGMRVRLAGVMKRQQNRIDLLNTGVPLSSYSVSTIVDGRPAADGGNVLLPVYNRLPSSFGRDQYLLTNNAAEEAATFSGVVLSGDIATGPWTFLFGATASQTDGLGANRGFHVDENDPGLAGEVFTDPNANTDARGRLFFDRAFTIKLASVYRFAHGVNIGLIARYQDGQPFSRVTVVPDLNQGTDFVRAYPAGDARFSFTGTFDMRLQKGFSAGRTRIDAILDWFNLFNLGYEVEERVVTGPEFRYITAIQPPTAAHVGVRITF